MDTIKELVKNPSTLIVDVRSPWEFEEEHIPGAQNIPLEEVPGKISEFKSRQQPVVFYCRSGNRSGMAFNILRQSGVTNVYNGGSLDEIKHLLN
ncbi:MAG: rhodanese-like domain-containing protein [Chitinophagaceae bacterium]